MNAESPVLLDEGFDQEAELRALQEWQEKHEKELRQAQEEQTVDKAVLRKDRGLPFGKRAISLRELGTANLERPIELVEGVLSEGETVVLIARPKTGKTRLAQQLSVAVARGHEADFLGLRVHKHVPVLYIDLESHPVDARDRFMKIAGEHWDSVQDAIHIYCVPSLIDSQVGLTSGGVKKLGEMIEETGAGLMIIDTWRLVFTGKENEADSVMRNLRALDALHSSNPNLTILLLHHLRKRRMGDGPALRLRTDAQLWLENASGHHALIAHTDASFGLEAETSNVAEIYVFAGVRRNGQPPFLMLRSDDETLRFERLDDVEQAAQLVFTAAQKELWKKLPERFAWKQAIDMAGGQRKKSLVSGTIKRARQNGLLNQPQRGEYVKTTDTPELAEPVA